MMLTKEMKSSIVRAARKVLNQQLPQVEKPTPPKTLKKKGSNGQSSLTENQSARLERWKERLRGYREELRLQELEVNKVLENLEAVLQPLESVVELLTQHPKIYLYLAPRYRMPVEDSLPNLSQEEINNINGW